MSALVPKKSITGQVRDCVITLAYVYGVDVLSMQNIVLGAVTEMQTIDMERLRKGARDWYQFENGQALPVLSERVQPHAARTMKEKEPSSQEEMLIKQLEEISPKQLLKEISGGAEATKADLQIVEDVMINQKLTPGVVNVLIYYVMLRSDMKLAKTKKKGRTAKKTVRKEMVPDWLKEEEPKEQEKETAKKDVSVEKDASTLEDERKRLEEVLKKYKRD